MSLGTRTHVNSHKTVPSSSHTSTSGVEIPPNPNSFTGYAHLEQFYEFAKNQGRTKKLNTKSLGSNIKSSHGLGKHF
jgi:hypothetical protein